MCLRVERKREVEIERETGGIKEGRTEIERKGKGNLTIWPVVFVTTASTGSMESGRFTEGGQTITKEG
jgi:hypothetical protein